MPRYKLIIEYDGNPYIGWQRQVGQKSVQGELETALFKFCGEPAEIVGAGRTDAGVHATAQVAHVDLSKTYEPFQIMQALNFHLFDGSENRISVLDAEEAPDDFHARFSAVKRHYRYRIVNRRARLGLEAGYAWQVVEPLDVPAMQAAAKCLLGTHDFSSFRDTRCQAKSPEKTLDHFAIGQNGENIFFETNARSFLHHQVRIMVGTLSMVGKGKWKIEDVKRALDAKDRKEGGPTAPPDGLYLVGVDY